MDKLIVIAIVVIVVLIGICLVDASASSARLEALEQRYKAECKVVGDAINYDSDGRRRTLTVYQCPDGLTHTM